MQWTPLCIKLPEGQRQGWQSQRAATRAAGHTPWPLGTPWRTRAEDGVAAPSTLTAPAEAGEITLTVIIRDPGGGVGWVHHTLTVTEAP